MEPEQLGEKSEFNRCTPLGAVPRTERPKAERGGRVFAGAGFGPYAGRGDYLLASASYPLFHHASVVLKWGGLA